MKQTRTNQSGFAAIAAIVVLTVLAGMGAFMVSFSNTQQLSSARDIQSTRAYWAARAGMDWAVGAITLDGTVCPTPPAPFTIDTGSSFTVTVTCTQHKYAEGSDALTIFTLESQATTGAVGTIGYVERSVSASIEVPM
jgi:MSHA biogenesis protein MshP